MKAKKLFIKLLVAATIITTPAVYAMETFAIDPSHSNVSWHVSHLGFSNSSGKWYVKEGTIELDKAKPQSSKVNVTIQVGELVTGNVDLDKHLKSADFFDVEKYPTATFVSNKVTMSGKDSAKIQGTLTLHGVSKQVTLNAKLNKMDMNPMTKKMTAGFSATTTLNREDYGIKAYLPAVGNEVKLAIELEATKAD